MSTNKIDEYYSYKDIDATGANYRVIIGERSNGKTYGFKKKVFDHWCETGKQFAYLRRTAEEIMSSRVGNYWNDLTDYINQELSKRFDYDFFMVQAYRGEFRVCGLRETNQKKEVIGTIGYYFALGQANYDKSNSYPDVDTICFEEFLTDGYELRDEFTKFVNFISTIKRKRTDMTVYMLGNTVNRNSQILEAMNINVRDLVQGSIKRYTYFGEGDITNTVAVEYCRNYAQSDESAGYFTFDNQREDMIVKGGWQVGAYPQFNLEEFFDNETPELGIVINTEQYRLYCYGCEHKDGFWFFVSPTRLAKRLEYFTLTNGSTNPNFRHFSYKGNNKVSIKLIKTLYNCQGNGHILFLDNLTGNDFDHAMYQMINL